MRRRRFLSILAAAVFTPPIPVQETLVKALPVVVPPKILSFTCYEEIGFTFCNIAGLQKVQFQA